MTRTMKYWPSDWVRDSWMKLPELEMLTAWLWFSRSLAWICSSARSSSSRREPCTSQRATLRPGEGETDSPRATRPTLYRFWSYTIQLKREPRVQAPRCRAPFAEYRLFT